MNAKGRESKVKLHKDLKRRYLLVFEQELENITRMLRGYFDRNYNKIVEEYKNLTYKTIVGE